jgi:hypothetical protein
MSQDAVSQQEEIQPNPVSPFRLFDAIDRQRIGDDLTGWVALASECTRQGASLGVQVASQDHSRSVILHMPQAIDAACGTCHKPLMQLVSLRRCRLST